MLSRWMDAIGDLPHDDSEDHAGTQVGAYKLLTQLGEGGFGTVWLAERKHPYTQRVALKLIKPGMDSKSVIARFEQERQALAVMNHPGIAKVLDGGLTQKGRPYFAMEFVKGEPITEFCDNRQLPIRDRLELFAQACEAVQHAHLKGIVHRDLKPSNILAFAVEGEQPRLKVIDFGIAKAMNQSLTEKTIFTETGQMIGTPAYMSPEQADPSLTDIDTRSDIYSLGVLLYELVTGATPFDPKELRSKAIGEIQRIIREEEPPTPSARLTTLALRDLGERAAIERARGIAVDDLARQLRSELEWIPLKAMRKEPHRRYQTAAALADEVRNYLAGRPLLAAPESNVYRLKKYLLRNRAVLVGSSAAALALMIGLTLAAVAFINMREEMVRADSEKAEAERQTRQAQAERMAADEARQAAESAAKKAAEQEQLAKDTQRQLVDRAYFENIQIAYSLAKAWDTRGQFDRLTPCEPAQRNWEWHWLNRRCDESLARLNLDGIAARSIAFGPDGDAILTVHRNGSVGVWKSSTGALIQSFTEPKCLDAVFGGSDSELLLLTSGGLREVADVRRARSTPTNCTFDDYGGRLVKMRQRDGWQGLGVASMDGRLSIWERRAGDWERLGSEIHMRNKNAEGSIDRIESSGPFGQLLARMERSEVRIYGVESGGSDQKRNLVSRSSMAGSLFTSSSEQQAVAVASGAHFMVWRGQSSLTRGAKPDCEDSSGTGAITSIELSARGDLLALARGAEVEIWTVDAGAPRMLVRESGMAKQDVTWMEFSPKADRLAWSTANGLLNLRSLAPGAETRTLVGHRSRIGSGAWHPDGSLLATASDDGDLLLWDPSTPSSARRTGRPITAIAVGSGSDGGCCFAFCDGETVFYGTSADRIDQADLAQLSMGGAQIRNIAIHPNRSLVALATDERKVHRWNPESDRIEMLGTFDGKPIELKYSPNGSHLAIPSSDRMLYIWDADGKKQPPLAHEGEIQLVEFARSGKYMATVAEGSGLTVWDGTNGWHKVANLSSLEGFVRAKVVHVAFEGDGAECIVVTDRGLVIRWNPPTGGFTLLCNEVHGEADRLVSATSDLGRGVLVTVDSAGSARQQTFGGQLAERFAREVQPSRQIHPVGRAAFLPQTVAFKRRALTVSKSGDYELWDPETGRRLIAIEGPPTTPLFAMSPDGTRCLIATDTGTLQVLDAIPYRVRFAEAAMRATGRAENLGLRYLGEAMEGDAATATWLTDPSRSALRPEFMIPKGTKRP